MFIEARFRSMLSTADICWNPDLLTVEIALAAALAGVRRVSGTETVPLRRSVGRVAARDVVATMPLPPFDQSAVDGYGIHHDDLPAATVKGFRQAGTTSAGASHTVCLNP